MAKATATKTKGKPTQSDLAEKIAGWYSKMEGDAGQWRVTWQMIADYVVPRKANINKRINEGQLGDIENLYNTTAMESAQIHAGGEMDYMFSGRFFKFTPERRLGKPITDEAQRYFAACTEIALDELLKSNFLLEVHEMLFDRVDFGTGSLYCEQGEHTSLLFCNDRIGTYYVAEGRDRLVNTLIRKIDLTASQAVSLFGLEKCGRSVQEAFQSGDITKQNKRFEFIHAIYPRESSERKPESLAAEDKEIASVYVDMTNKVVCRESGYDEMPMAVTRYLKWNKDPYGYSPSMIALPTSRQVNFIERCMDALAETKAFPRVLIPDNLDGNDVDFRATGQTVYDANRPEALPKEWLTQGEYNIGLERIKTKDDLIKRLYLVDLWQMLANIEREMTAYEVQQRLAEKITGITPAFHRMQTEFFNPILRRVFGLLYRQGKFPTPPPELLKPDPKDPNNIAKATLDMPQVVLTGKLAMAIRAAETNSLLQWVQMVMPLTQVLGPSVLDPVDFSKAGRATALNMGIPVDWQRSEGDMRKIDKQRQDAAAQQQQMQAAQVSAQAMGNLGKAPQQMQAAASQALQKAGTPQQGG